MASILLTWELGGGMGHLANLAPLARGLVERGHRVTAALADLSRAHRAFAGVPVAFLQAPLRARSAGRPESQARTFAHVLLDNGFAEAGQLRTLVEAWRNLFEFIRPDLIVFDHSPTALLAARGRSTRRVLIGTAFFSPTDQYPLADLRPWLPDDSARCRQDEDRVLENANRVLAAFGQQPLERIAQLYQEVDENFLTTFPEFDPYVPEGGRRKAEGRGQNARYWGPMLFSGGKAPEWPEGRGKRIYAYLKPFPALPRLLALLDEVACPTLVYGDGLAERFGGQFPSKTLRFERERLDMAEVGRQCDLAILNGTAATTAAILLAGKPILQVPIYLEQALVAAAVSRLGMGLSASPEQIAVRLTALLQNDRYAEAAGAFALRHADFDPKQQVAGMLARIDGLLQPAP
jgi:UDP:flavonoid glycosyltransferase YjiC (YdhE family)